MNIQQIDNKIELMQIKLDVLNAKRQDLIKKQQEKQNAIIDLGETRKIKELGIEITKVIFKGKSFNEIQTLIPKGWRMLNVNEGIHIVNDDGLFEWTNHSTGNDDFWIKQPFELNKKNGYAAGFRASSDGVYLDCWDDPTYSDSGLGCIFAR